MKRDMDLIREILLEIESWKPGSPGKTIALQGRPYDEVKDHVLLLLDAGLIELQPNVDRGLLIVSRLTWAGHEFLEATRRADA